MHLNQKLGRILLMMIVTIAVPKAFAQPQVRLGNALVRTEAIEKVIRGMVADAMKGSLNQNSLSLESEAFNEQLKIPAASPEFREILNILGIKNTLSLAVSPIHTRFTLPESALKIEIKNPSQNEFLIKAHWSLTQLVAQAQSVAIKVPAGFFPQAFSIRSAPVRISLSRNSPAVQFDATFSAQLSNHGTRIRLLNFRTNLEGSGHPNFVVRLGSLTANGRPLTLEIRSNGQVMTANEPSIRAQFQSIEPELAHVIRQKIGDAVEKQTRIQAQKIERQAPLHYSTHSDEWLEKLDLKPASRKLLAGIDFDFNFSFLQAVKSFGVYSAQIAARICFDGKYLADLGRVSPIGSRDLEVLHKDDEVSAIVYESMLQNFVHSREFQKRIRNFYYSGSTLSGVNLAPSGMKVYLDPEIDGLVGIINLEIDIKKTIKEGTPFGRRLKRKIGDVWELWFGSGQIVKIPIEVNFRIIGLIDVQGKKNLMITTELPFQKDGILASTGRCPPSVCPNNVSQMTQMVRPEFLQSIKEELELIIPAVINIPVGEPVNFQNFSAKLRNVRVTPNHGLLITGQIKNVPGESP